MYSENVTDLGDRRTRKRMARREALLDIAADLIDEVGVAGLTMAALGEASDYAPASLYTYFESRSALLAALQQRALVTLAAVANERIASFDSHVAQHAQGSPEPVLAVARLWVFSEMFLTAPRHHGREFRLQQELLVTPGSETLKDATSVVPAAMAVLEVPRALIAHTTEIGLFDTELASAVGGNSLTEEVDPAIARTIAWVLALNGALLSDMLATGVPSSGYRLGADLTISLLRGWGAPAGAVSAGVAFATEAISILGPVPSSSPSTHPTNLREP